MNDYADFPTFSHELWGYDPFRWQEMLAVRTAARCWPQALDLPTASGKTACIDVTELLERELRPDGVRRPMERRRGRG